MKPAAFATAASMPIHQPELAEAVFTEANMKKAGLSLEARGVVMSNTQVINFLDYRTTGLTTDNWSSKTKADFIEAMTGALAVAQRTTSPAPYDTLRVLCKGDAVKMAGMIDQHLKPEPATKLPVHAEDRVRHWKPSEPAADALA